MDEKTPQRELRGQGDQYIVDIKHRFSRGEEGGVINCANTNHYLSNVDLDGSVVFGSDDSVACGAGNKASFFIFLVSWQN